MEKLVTTWADDKTLPETYVHPPGKRPGDHAIPTSHTIPVIDLTNADGVDNTKIACQIVEAVQNFGFFQVINHGVPRKLMDDTIGVFREFMELPAEKKAKFWFISKNFMLYTSNINYEKEALHYWRDAAVHTCNPLEDSMLDWPLNPSNYREVVRDYVINLRELGSRILDLICVGLGLEPGYFEGMSQEPFLMNNYYPACPDPSLTLGTGKHCDPNLITLLLQDDVQGLQVFENGEWTGVEPTPNAFVVNIGLHLHIVSNGMLRSVEHRVVTNSSRGRISAAFFIVAGKDCTIEPAKAIVGPENPPLYKRLLYADLFQAFRAFYAGEIECPLKPFLLKPA